MKPLAYLFAFVALMLSGATFGFFYALVCSTMSGLDAAEPAVAIAAMQAMNASVRNWVFAPAFFGTPVALLAAAVPAFKLRWRTSAIAFGLGAMLYLLGALLVTMAVNVSMNEALATVDVRAAADKARQLWQDYSSAWQAWNTVRTLTTGVVLALTGFGLYAMGQRDTI